MADSPFSQQDARVWRACYWAGGTPPEGAVPASPPVPEPGAATTAAGVTAGAGAVTGTSTYSARECAARARSAPAGGLARIGRDEQQRSDKAVECLDGGLVCVDVQRGLQLAHHGHLAHSRAADERLPKQNVRTSQYHSAGKSIRMGKERPGTETTVP